MHRNVRPSWWNSLLGRQGPRCLPMYDISIMQFKTENNAMVWRHGCSLKLEAFEMLVYWRILQLSWVDRVTNENAFGKMNKKLEVMKNMKIRKHCYLGYIMRNPKYHLQLIQGRLCWRRGPGTRIIAWLKNLIVRQWLGKIFVQITHGDILTIYCVSTLSQLNSCLLKYHYFPTIN